MEVPLGRHVVVIAGPSGSGKDSIIRELLARCSNTTKLVTVTTRAPRAGEEDGVSYYFRTNEWFKAELEKGTILEHYYRPETDTYYGTYKPDLEARIESGKVVLCQIQIVGAQYLKEHYNAATIFIMPPSPEAFEKRIRARSPMSDAEWAERAQFTAREIAEEAPWYDYRISNEDGKLEEAVSQVIAVLEKEGFVLH